MTIPHLHCRVSWAEIIHEIQQNWMFKALTSLSIKCVLSFSCSGFRNKIFSTEKEMIILLISIRC